MNFTFLLSIFATQNIVTCVGLSFLVSSSLCPSALFPLPHFLFFVPFHALSPLQNTSSKARSLSSVLIPFVPENHFYFQELC